MIYLIGSLRNPQIPHIAGQLREAGWEVFDDWYSPGKTTDEDWMAYEVLRGRGYREALAGYHAQEVFNFDKVHLDRCEMAVLVMPAGKSGHLELGYVIGKGKPGFILLPGEPERFEIMHNFATGIAFSVEELQLLMEDSWECLYDV